MFSLTKKAGARVQGIGLPTSLSCQRSSNLQSVLDLAAKLPDRFFVIRENLYTDRGNIYAGELKSCTAGGGQVLSRPDWSTRF